MCVENSSVIRGSIISFAFVTSDRLETPGSKVPFDVNRGGSGGTDGSFDGRLAGDEAPRAVRLWDHPCVPDIVREPIVVQPQALEILPDGAGTQIHLAPAEASSHDDWHQPITRAVRASHLDHPQRSSGDIHEVFLSSRNRFSQTGKLLQTNHPAFTLCCLDKGTLCRLLSLRRPGPKGRDPKFVAPAPRAMLAGTLGASAGPAPKAPRFCPGPSRFGRSFSIPCSGIQTKR